MSQPEYHLTADNADAYLHDLCDAGDKALVEQHCAECEPCRTVLEQGRKRLATLTTLPAHEPSEQLIQATLKTVEEHEPRLRRRRRRDRLIGSEWCSRWRRCRRRSGHGSELRHVVGIRKRKRRRETNRRWRGIAYEARPTLRTPTVERRSSASATGTGHVLSAPIIT